MSTTTTPTTTTHYHVTGYWDNDESDYRPLDFWSAIEELAERLTLLVDNLTESADIQGDAENFEQAWHDHKRAETLNVAQINLSRFDSIRRSEVSERPPAFQGDDTNETMRISAEWAAGLRPNYRGEYVDLLTLSMDKCNDGYCLTDETYGWCDQSDEERADGLADLLETLKVDAAESERVDVVAERLDEERRQRANA